jgi:hypothetical protein
MAFKITEGSDQQHFVEVGERLWLAEDRETVVADGDAAAAFLLATPGTRLSREDAERYGLVKASKAKAADTSSEDPQAEQADTAAAKKPAGKAAAKK